MKFTHIEVFDHANRHKQKIVAVPETEEEGRALWESGISFHCRSLMISSQYSGLYINTRCHDEHNYRYVDGNGYVDMGPRDYVRDFGSFASKAMGRWHRRNDSRSAWPRDEFGTKADYVLRNHKTFLVHRSRV